jgi:hypothetical protein
LFQKQSLRWTGGQAYPVIFDVSGGNSDTLRCLFRETFVCVHTRRRMSVASGFWRDNCGCKEFRAAAKESANEKILRLTAEAQRTLRKSTEKYESYFTTNR